MRKLILAVVAIAGVVMASGQESISPAPQILDVQNSASWGSGLGGLVPGSIVSILGTNLVPTQELSNAVILPLPTSLGGVTVQLWFSNAQGITVNKIFAPLLATVGNAGGKDQINFQVPWELSGQANVQLVITRSDGQQTSMDVSGLSTQPGIFTYGVFACAQHADATLITSASPALPGETIVVYGTGFGAVGQPQTDGAGASALTLSGYMTSTLPTVTIGGMPATVQYSGLTPGSVGLYQANVTVPTNIPSGDQFIQIAFGNATSNQAVLPIAGTAAATPITIAPVMLTTFPGATQQFGLQGVPSGAGIIWSASVGTIDANGLWTAPATLPNLRVGAVTATIAGTSTSIEASVVVQYPFPVVSAINISHQTMYVDGPVGIGGIVLTGQNLLPGDVVSIGPFALSALAPGTNPTSVAIGMGIGSAQAVLAGWWDIQVTTPDGNKSNVLSLAFPGGQNTAAVDPQSGEVFQNDQWDYVSDSVVPSQSYPVVWKFKPDGTSDQKILILPVNGDGIAIDSGYVLTTPTVAVAEIRSESSSSTTIYADLSGGIENASYPRAQSIAALNGIGCTTQLEVTVSCFPVGITSGAATSLSVGVEPWAVAMATSGTGLSAIVYSREDTTLWNVSVSGTTPDLSVSAFVPLGFTQADQLRALLVGGWSVATFNSGSATGTAAVLSSYDEAVAIVGLSPTMALEQTVSLVGAIPADTYPFRIVADQAHSALIVALADPFARLTRFAKVDVGTGTVTMLNSTSNLLAVGLAVSADGTNLYSCMRASCQVLPNQ